MTGITVFNAQNCGIHQSGIAVLYFRNDGSESSGILTIFLPQYKEYKKYVHFKDENLQRITQVETAQDQNYNLPKEEITLVEAKQVERIYMLNLRLRWNEIKAYEDLLNFPNAEYVQLGVTEGYESGDSAGRAEYM